MLTDLIATIETLKGRIKEHRPYFDVGRPEARTRVSLIDPLLRALEWDVSDPSLVEIEPIVGPGRADYAFLGRAGEPLLLLEAKKLSDTKAHHGQLASYVVGENLKRAVKIPYCAMTNGSRWQVFDVFTQECVLDASVEHEHARKCALKLIGLWQPALREIGLETVVDLGGIVAGNESGDTHGARRSDTASRPAGRAASGKKCENCGIEFEPNNKRGFAPRFCSAKCRVAAHRKFHRQHEALSEEGSGPWTPLDSRAINPSKHVRPRQMRFPDGGVAKPRSWRQVLVATAKWLFDEGLLDPRDLPLAVVGAKCCVSTDGRRPDGRPFRKPLPVAETGIQVEGDLTGEQIVRFAAALLERSGRAPSDVELKLAN